MSEESNFITPKFTPESSNQTNKSTTSEENMDSKEKLDPSEERIPSSNKDPDLVTQVTITASSKDPNLVNKEPITPSSKDPELVTKLITSSEDLDLVTKKPITSSDDSDLVSKESITTPSERPDLATKVTITTSSKDPNLVTKTITTSSKYPNLVTKETITTSSKDPNLVTKETITTSSKDPELVTKKPIRQSSEEDDLVTKETITTSSKNPELVTKKPITPTSEDADLVTKETITTSSKDPNLVTKETITTSSKDPELVTKKPITPTSEDADLVTKETITTSSKDPNLVTKETITTSSKDPELVTKKPITPSSEDSDLVTEEPITSSNEDPDVVTKEPIISVSKDPELVNKEPITSNEDPDLVTKEPIKSSSRDPNLVTKEPITPSSEDPDRVTKEPITSSSEDPDVVTKEPITSSEDSDCVIKELYTSASKDPNLVTKEIITSATNDPELVTKEPITTSSKDPELVTKELITSSEDPDLVTKKPITASDDSDLVTKEPITSSSKNPELVTKELVTSASKYHSLVTKEPITSIKDSDLVTKEPITPSSKDPNLVTQEPITSASASKDPHLVTKKPITSSEDPVLVTKEPITSASKDPSLVTKEPVPSSGGDHETIDPSVTVDKQQDAPSVYDNPVPSTSKHQKANKPTASEDEDMEHGLAPDASDEVPEVADSLGLLAESSVRVVDEEEDQDPEQEDEEDGDDEDDVDDDQDDESNLPTADHSEESNPQTSETDVPKDPADDQLLEKEPTILEEIEIEDVNMADVDGTEDVDGRMDVDDSNSEDKTTKPDVIPTEGTLVLEPTPVDNIETFKLSDTSDESEINSEAEGNKGRDSLLKNLLEKKCGVPEIKSRKSPEKAKSQPDSPINKKRKLEISQRETILNIVDLGGSSSEDDIQEVNKAPITPPGQQVDETSKDDNDESQVTTTVNIPKEVDIISAATGTTSEIEDKEGETIIKGLPKPVIAKKAKLNTSEISIKTAPASSEPTLVIPETRVADQGETEAGKTPKRKFGLEVFNLDSDEENSTEAVEPDKSASPTKPPLSPRCQSRCVNPTCTSKLSVERVNASAAILRYYDVTRRRKAQVCRPCADRVAERSFGMVEGVVSMRPLLEIEMSRQSQQLVEISDSDSDGEKEDATGRDVDKIGAEGARHLEGQLAAIINETWIKYKLDERLRVATDEINDQLDKLEKERAEIDAMLDSCQAATDKLRYDLYSTFPTNTRSLPALDIMDTPFAQYSTPASETEFQHDEDIKQESQVRRSKRKTTFVPTSKKESSDLSAGESKDDDNTDIKVVKLSAEVAPVDLPPSGTLVRPALITGQPVFAMRHAFGSWLKGLVLDISPKGTTPQSAQFSVCKVRFEHKVRNPIAQISARHLAYPDPAPVRLTIGTRVIALFSDMVDTSKRRSYYSGVVAEMPNPVNSYRYLVFFDDGYAQYVTHAETRVVCECSNLVWEEVHPFSREFVRQYLVSYPERPMVRLHAGQSLKTEWNGKWWVSKVIRVDASLVQIHFEADDRTEWIYRGSTRLAPLYLELQNAERPRARPLPRSTQHRQNIPYVEYTRSDEPETGKPPAPALRDEDMKRQRAVAKKSTAQAPSEQRAPPPAAHQPLDNVMSRVVYYTPKAAVRPYRMTPHSCSRRCQRDDVLPLSELRTYNPLARPLLSGWERQICRFKGRKEVMYRAPCGRRLRNMPELHRYLTATESEMGVDLFDFAVSTHCLAEFVLNRCLVSKKDLSHGKENVPVPCVNYYDNSLPEFCSYNTERTPTAGVPLNIDPEFLCGCDCTDDCQDKSKCACWKMTLDGARTIGMDIDDIGYVYKRLLDPVPSGIYECNSRCKCKQTCLNRVAQHPLQLKLQVFKTLNRGWGIRALNDVPRGAFLCVYAGNLLTDATANLDGLNEGDEYLAELDYIEVVEQMKEGYEEDIPDKDKEKDKGSSESDADEEEYSSSSSGDERRENAREKKDNDFRPAYEIPAGCLEFSKRLRRRDKRKRDKRGEAECGASETDAEQRAGDCITISDDEEVREPQSFAAQVGMGSKEFVSKHRSVRTLYGKDEACYIMDAKVQGNIGRYLNHSCTPNVFVQNVFVDTHDPRFPWVAFFALSYIRAGTELTWNYNYDVGSVPGKILYCYCGAPNCRGRLL